jgi:hypothetical protein
VHAFGPQTFADRLHRLLHRDFRHARQMRAVRRLPELDRTYLDLKPVLARAARHNAIRQRHVIHYAEGDRLDALHARRLRRISTVELRRYPFSDHNVIGLLRESGELPRLMRSIVVATD